MVVEHLGALECRAGEEAELRIEHQLTVLKAFPFYFHFA
jgi:hypothetical protein